MFTLLWLFLVIIYTNFCRIHLTKTRILAMGFYSPFCCRNIQSRSAQSPISRSGSISMHKSILMFSKLRFIYLLATSCLCLLLSSNGVASSYSGDSLPHQAYDLSRRQCDPHGDIVPANISMVFWSNADCTGTPQNLTGSIGCLVPIPLSTGFRSFSFSRDTVSGGIFLTFETGISSGWHIPQNSTNSTVWGAWEDQCRHL